MSDLCVKATNIFEPRISLKPYEYPEVMSFKEAIRRSYWVHDEFESAFHQDIQDYKVALNDSEREIVKRTMLAIAQIEVSVKEFWGDIYKYLPKPEIGAVGYTFSECEVRHFDAYSHLLDLLGLNEEFEKISEVGAIADRIQYLSAYTKGHKSKGTNKAYAMSILLFSIFVEHVSLFSQFLIMMSFNKFKLKLTGISNAVEATSKEEQIHGDFGVFLLDIIRKENPEWFDVDFEKNVIVACEKAYKAERKILDWIFETGELSFLPRKHVDAFLKDRFNRSLQSIGLKPIYDVSKEDLNSVYWFDEEILSSAHVDFFHKRPTSYSKFTRSYNVEDLF